MTKLRLSRGFSLANLYTESRDIETFGDDGFSTLLMNDRAAIIYPDPTPADREQYKLPKRGEWQGEGWSYEFEGNFHPMMNYLWPVDLAYGRSEQEAANLMHRLGGATSLVEIHNDHYLALTGGGMNLAWHIAAGYVCCGCVPPIEILDSLRGSPFRMSKGMNRAILAASREGTKAMVAKAKRLAQDLRRIDPTRDGDRAAA